MSGADAIGALSVFGPVLSVLVIFAVVGAVDYLLEDKPGTRQSANSASSEASLMGAGMGAKPMSTVVQPVPGAIVARPCAAVPLCPDCRRACLAALGAEGSPLAGEVSAQAAGAQALPDGNHGDNKKVAEPTPGVTA